MELQAWQPLRYPDTVPRIGIRSALSPLHQQRACVCANNKACQDDAELACQAELLLHANYIQLTLCVQSVDKLLLQQTVLHHVPAKLGLVVCYIQPTCHSSCVCLCSCKRPSAVSTRQLRSVSADVLS